MAGDEWVRGELEKLRSKGLYRSLRTSGRPAGLLDLSGNDYLNLARDPRLGAAAAAAIERLGTGAGASRLLSGSLPVHDELERALAAHKGYPAAVLFGSGFLANVGAIPALVGRGDAVFLDRLAHASLISAAILSRASIRRFRHNDPEDLSDLLGRSPGKGRRLIVTESVFSMDGDLAPLREIAEIARSHGAMLMVDEAHATGVFGPEGSGLVAEAGLREAVTLCMGTLSKALGGYGGYIACEEHMCRWLINRARTFVYTTALPPAVAASALAALAVLREEPGLGVEVRRRAELFRKLLTDAGLCTGNSASPIVPVIVGENEKVTAISARLRACGILAAAIRPPTVPGGTARLRLSVTLAHSDDDLARAADAIVRCAREAGML